MVQMGPFIQQCKVQCNRCDGEGTSVSQENKQYICKTCLGKKVSKQDVTLEVHIDKGMKENQKITFDGEADEMVRSSSSSSSFSYTFINFLRINSPE